MPTSRSSSIHGGDCGTTTDFYIYFFDHKNNTFTNAGFSDWKHAFGKLIFNTYNTNILIGKTRGGREGGIPTTHDTCSTHVVWLLGKRMLYPRNEGLFWSNYHQLLSSLGFFKSVLYKSNC